MRVTDGLIADEETRGPFRKDWESFAVPKFFRPSSKDDKADGVSANASRLGVDFMRACQDQIVLSVGNGAQLIINQLPADDTQLGAVVWDCGVVLCRVLYYLRECMGQNWLQKALVVEFGSGTGVGGLCASHLGAGRCILSDQEGLLGLLRKNVVCNPKCASTVSVQVYHWGAPFPNEFELNVDEEFRLVLCSDVLYAAAAHPQLLKSLDLILNSRTLVLLSVKYRNTEQEILFLEDLSKLNVCVHAIPLEWCAEAVRHEGNTTSLAVFLLSRPHHSAS